MAFVPTLEVYDALPIPNDALDKGGVEMLRAGVVDEELFVTARRAFSDPAHWGYLLADVTRRLATLYAAEGDFTEARVTTAIAGAFARSLRADAVPATRKPAAQRAAKSAPARNRARAKPKLKSAAPRKGARAKP